MIEMPSASLRDLSRRLLAAEAARESAAHSHAHEGVRVCEKLRISLTRFAGADGFTALMRRALALARAEVPALEQIQLEADGRMQGLEDLPADAGHDAAVAATAHLLGLLVTFIGEPLTLRLVREAFPDASWDM